MAKRATSRRIKTHRQYTYEQAATSLDVSVQTVRSWRRVGLPVLTAKTPHLIIGAELKAFLDQRRHKAAQRLRPEQFRCMRCRAPVQAYGGMADYTPMTASRGVLAALCASCECACAKLISRAQLDDLARILEIAMPNGEQD